MTITYRVSLQAWLALVALALMVWLLISHSAALLELGFVLLGALLLTLAIRPFADYLTRYYIPRAVTAMVMYGVLLLVLVLMGQLLVPVVETEIAQVRQNAPQLWDNVQTQLANMSLGDVVPSTDAVVQNLVQQINTVFSSAVGTVTGLGRLLVDGFALLILSYFFTTDTGWNGRLLLWVPPARQPGITQMLDHIQERLTRWVWAQILISLFFAITFGTGMGLMHVPFALTIAVVSGVLGLIPYVGNIIALLFATISALTISPALALWVVVLNLIVGNVAAHILAPWLYGRAMGLHSAWMLLALLCGAKVAGVMGVFFAVPVTVMITAVLQETQLLNYEPVAAETHL
jgi:predicted PurR-regulated permease PerM